MATFSGTANNDNSWPTIGKGNVDDFVNGFGGDDVGADGNGGLQGYGGSDTVHGGDGNDVIWGDTKSLLNQSPDDGGDLLFGDAGSDTIYGNAGNDYLNGGTGSDTCYGGTGNDKFETNLLDGDYYDGGDGIDVIRYTDVMTPLSVDLGAGTARDAAARVNSLSGIEQIEAPQIGYAQLFGNDASNLFEAHNANNHLDGRGGDDILYGGSGTNNVLIGGTGNDSLFGKGVGDWLDGSIGNDTLYGSVGSSVLLGGADNDTLFGNVSGDRLDGGTGVDKLYGGDGNDTYFVDSASDQVVESGAGLDIVFASASYALAASSRVETLQSANPAAASIHLYGNANPNAIIGSSGVNLIFGYDGADKLTALGGKDKLTGGRGADKLTGGAGADLFILTSTADSTTSQAGRDTIFDFSLSGGDLVYLRTMDANVRRSGDQAFTWLGKAGFTGHAGELRFVLKPSDTFVYGDVNGDRRPDFALHFDDKLLLTRSDFVL